MDLSSVDHLPVFENWLSLVQVNGDHYAGFPTASCSVDGHQVAGLFRGFVNRNAVGMVLDVGCGPQPVPVYATEINDDGRLLGLDPIDAQHPFAFRQGIAEKIPWPDAMFDTVIIATSLDHFVDPVKALKEVQRVLVPGGTLLVWVGLIDDSAEYDPMKPTDPVDEFHLFHHSRQQFEQLFEETGFGCMESIDQGESAFYKFRVAEVNIQDPAPPDGPKPRLVVGVPWDSPMIWADTFASIADLEHPEGYDVRFVMGRGWCPARRHEDLCERAVLLGADLILILGADQIYERDLLVRLIGRWEDGHEIVCALVPTRGYVANQAMRPFQPVAWRFKSQNGTADIKHFHSLLENPDMIEVIDRDGGEMQRINFIGSGVLMFQMDHLLALERPWFKETIKPKDYTRIANMDCTFVWRLQTEAFADVWCDTTIMVKHIHPMQIDDTYQHRFKDFSEKGVCGDKNLVPQPIEEYQPLET